jgi:hypothetical protein
MQKSGRPFPGSSGRCATVLGDTSHRLQLCAPVRRHRLGCIDVAPLSQRTDLFIVPEDNCSRAAGKRLLLRRLRRGHPLLRSSLTKRWRRFRPVLWLAGTLFATLLATYWTADEIYPFVN